MNSPIVLFVYNRPYHTKKTLEALKHNILAKESELFIFADGPKKNKEDLEIKQVREIINNVSGFKKVYVKESPINLGLAQSIVGGVTEILNRYKSIIVLEDDIITSPFFLNYMNEALEMYKEDIEVMHVSGYFFKIKEKLPQTFFYNQTTCWGWGTWSRAWINLSMDPNYLLSEIKKNRHGEHRFNIDGSNDSFIKQLQMNISGELRTWAIKWQASVFIKNGLCLHPRYSYTTNIGLDGSGQNCGKTKKFDIPIVSNYSEIKRIPLVESKEARQAVINYNKRYFYINKCRSFIKKIINLIIKL
jgi:hypothetical protein